MKETKVEINGREYTLDVEKAIKDGYLKEAYPLQAGDVYTSPERKTCPWLLVRCVWQNDVWQLLGMGCSPNSDEFFYRTHTIEEIENYLKSHNMTFNRNINLTIMEMVGF